MSFHSHIFVRLGTVCTLGGFDAIKDAQTVMYLGRGDYDSYQIARNDLEDSGWLSPEIEINSLDKIPLGEYLQAGISKIKSTDWA